MRKFIEFINKKFRFKSKLNTNVDMELRADVTLVNIEESFEDKNINPGDIVLHKNNFVYKIIDFGLMQIDGRWCNSVLYTDLENDDGKNLIFVREWSDFVKSFKFVQIWDNAYVKIKGDKR